jgi:hypothetical protein
LPSEEENKNTAEEPAKPPPIPDRPLKTLSIVLRSIMKANNFSWFVFIQYTKPKCEGKIAEQLLANGTFAKNRAGRKKRMSDDEVMARLRAIVTIGNPDRRYEVGILLIKLKPRNLNFKSKNFLFFRRKRRLDLGIFNFKPFLLIFYASHKVHLVRFSRQLR